MSRDFTVFQFDVDEETVRSLMESIPGVTPLPLDDHDATDNGSAAESAERRPTDGASGQEAGGEPMDSTTGTTGSATDGVDSDTDETHSETGPGSWTRPSTPWPGAPTGEEDEGESGGWVARLTDKRTLLVGGAVVIVGAVGAAAVWYLKLRGADEASTSGDGVGSWMGDADEAAAEDEKGERKHVDERTTEDAASEPHADDEESCSYPVDFAPLIGMVFLAAGSVLLQSLQSESED